MFCPLLWDGSGQRSARPEGLEYHDDDGRTRDRLPHRQGAIDAAEARDQARASAETMRLIYVALTRAVHRCYLVAGSYCTAHRQEPVAQGKHPHAAELAGGRRRPDAGAVARRRAGAGRHQPPGARWPPQRAAHRAGAAAERGRRSRSACERRRPTRWPRCRRRRRSRRLVHRQLQRLAMAPPRARRHDHDARATAAPVARAAPLPIAGDDILRFPRGAVAGECLHAVFERDRLRRRRTWEAAIAERCAASAAGPVAAAGEPDRALAARMRDDRRMLHDVLHDAAARRHPAGRRAAARAPGRAGVPPAGAAARAGALTRCCARHGYEVPALAFGDAGAATCNGFIDLVFEHDGRYYVARLEIEPPRRHAGRLRPAALAAAMAQQGYHLQPCCTRWRCTATCGSACPTTSYERHFGGVLYLFVRGVRPAWMLADGTPAGVFCSPAERCSSWRAARAGSRTA